LASLQIALRAKLYIVGTIGGIGAICKKNYLKNKYILYLGEIPTLLL
jgi:hypothetical protein